MNEPNHTAVEDARHVPDTPREQIVLFDGLCGMCDRAVQFVIKHDPDKKFRFAPLQSPVAKELLSEHGIDPAGIDSVVLVDGDRVFLKSTAALKIALELTEPWPLLGLLGFVPSHLRDAAYDYVARHRLQWFKPRAECRIPSPEDRERFIG